MSIKGIEEKIAARANTQVQNKIAAFKQAIDKALSDLFGTEQCASYRFGEYYDAEEGVIKRGEKHLEGAYRKLTVLRYAIQDYANRPSGLHGDVRKEYLAWPEWLWRQEENRIREELLAKMDLMSQLLMSSPATEGDAPCEGRVNVSTAESTEQGVSQ